MPLLNILAARCDEQGSRDAYGDLMSVYKDFVSIVGKFKKLSEAQKLTEEQHAFLKRTLLDPDSTINLFLKETFGPFINKINKALKEESKVGQQQAKVLLRRLCQFSEEIHNVFNHFVSEAMAMKVTAQEEEIIPIAEPEEEQLPVEEDIATETEERMLAALWNQREVAEALMPEVDKFYENLASEKFRDSLPQDLKAKIASLLETHKDIVELFDEKDKLLTKAKDAVLGHIQLGEYFSQATLGLITRLTYLFDAIVIFAAATAKLAGEIEGNQTLASVIFGRENFDYNMLDTMQEISLRLREVSLVENG